MFLVGVGRTERSRLHTWIVGIAVDANIWLTDQRIISYCTRRCWQILLLHVTELSPSFIPLY